MPLYTTVIHRSLVNACGSELLLRLLQNICLLNGPAGDVAEQSHSMGVNNRSDCISLQFTPPPLLHDCSTTFPVNLF